jgi:nucleotide-binding universal stress UspA family protein
MFEKILVPLDMSALAEQVIPHAVEMAKAFGSQIDIINICEPHSAHDESENKAYCESETGKIQAVLGTNRVKCQVISGSPEQQILGYIKQENIKLIFMSSHGRSGIMPWALGSTVDKVLRRTEIPLVVVKAKTHNNYVSQDSLFKRILVTLDGSERGAKVVPYAAEIARKLKSELVFLHVVDTDRRVHNLGRIDTIPFIESELVSIQKRAQEYLDTERKKFSDLFTSAVTKSGNVAGEILKYARETDCTLIGMSSHGHSGLESWVIGSVTNKVLHGSEKSLLFVPALET